MGDLVLTWSRGGNARIRTASGSIRGEKVVFAAKSADRRAPAGGAPPQIREELLAAGDKERFRGEARLPYSCNNQSN
jgi:hypothetical protein